MTPEQQVRAAVAHLPKVKYVPRWDSDSIAGKGSFTPRFVMLHHTAGTSSLAYMTRSNGEWGPVRLAHFLIDRDGTVHVCAAVKTYHAGAGGPRWGVAAGAMNAYAWGIEIEDLGRSQTMTEAQIESAAVLTAGLIDAMGVTDANVIQHKEWNPSGKTDTRYSTEFWRDRVAAARKKVEVATIKVPTFHPGGPEYKTPLADPVTVVGSKSGYVVARTTLGDGLFLLTLQTRMPKDVTVAAEMEFVRIGWGTSATDETGHHQIAPATLLYDEWHRWRTVNHAIHGGGPVDYKIYMPPGTYAMRFVAKAERIA